MIDRVHREGPHMVKTNLPPSLTLTHEKIQNPITEHQLRPLNMNLISPKMAKPFQGLSICPRNRPIYWQYNLHVSQLVCCPFLPEEKFSLNQGYGISHQDAFEVSTWLSWSSDWYRPYAGHPQTCQIVPQIKRISGLVCDEYHLIFECQTLSQLRAKYCHLLTPHSSTLRQFMWQTDTQAVMLFVKEAFKILLSWSSRVRFLAVKGCLPPTLSIKFANCLVGCSGWIPVIRQVVQ